MLLSEEPPRCCSRSRRSVTRRPTAIAIAGDCALVVTESVSGRYTYGPPSTMGTPMLGKSELSQAATNGCCTDLSVRESRSLLAVDLPIGDQTDCFRLAMTLHSQER